MTKGKNRTIYFFCQEIRAGKEMEYWSDGVLQDINFLPPEIRFQVSGVRCQEKIEAET
jgi:hypothetical protein